MTAKRRLNYDAIRRMCIRNQYCTCATNEDYEPIIHESLDEELTLERTLNIARRIYCMSDIKALKQRTGRSSLEILHDICWYIINECSTTHLTLKEEDLI